MSSTTTYIVLKRESEALWSEIGYFTADWFPRSALRSALDQAITHLQEDSNDVEGEYLVVEASRHSCQRFTVDSHVEYDVTQLDAEPVPVPQPVDAET
ncbi:MAG TPA: hypothetical protein VN213_04330 [Solirubrobacteraceae bacterium]|nr:hypothetical protein [Solirubrobacteraceae bacterium]